MAEEGKLTLNNRWYGMSANEYDGGSFYYWENINVRENGKTIRLATNMSSYEQNLRTNWYWVAFAHWSTYSYIFTYDWYVETVETFNWLRTSTSIGWALYKRSSWNYVNATKIWDNYLGITADKIDRFVSLPNIFWTAQWADTVNIVSNPNITSDTDWTVWAWWTTGVTGAVHTAGNTATLTHTFASTDRTKKYRIAVMVRYQTAGTVTIKLDNSTIVWTISTASDIWSVFYVFNNIATRTTIDIVPSSDFNGTVSCVMVSAYDDSRVNSDEMTITSATKHPLLYNAWSLYIWSWAVIDLVDTGTRTVQQLNVVDSDYTIVWFTQVGSQIIIWANNGYSSKQYFWDWVEAFPSEVVTYKGMVITWVDSDWVYNYIVTQSGNDRKLYVVSWYTKTMLATSVNSNWYGYATGKKAHLLNTRNDFDCTYSNILCYDNKVAIPSYKGIYTYWYEIPWQNNSLVKSWDIWLANIYALSHLPWYWLCCVYKQTYTDLITEKPWTRTFNFVGRESKYKTYRGVMTLVTNSIVWDNISTDKQLAKFKFWYTLWRPQDYINVYIRANDKYFWTFWVSWVTTAPVTWDTYTIWNTTFTVISTDITWWTGTISCSSVSTDGYNIYGDSTTKTLTKVSGSWDSSISSSDYDNFIKIKSITATQWTMWEAELFSSDFIAVHAPNWNKVQFKFEMYGYSSYYSPEIYDVNVLADIIN